MKRVIYLALFLFCADCTAQNQNNIWCFGDSTGIDFNSAAAMPIVTSLDTRGSCISIADPNGNLLFYANTRAATAGNTTLVYNKLHQLMQNGNNIVGEGWYHELVVIPKPADDSVYYLFSIGVTGSSMTGLFCSIIDLKINNGLGAVTTANFQLQSFKQVDCLSAVKHGNGQDWWIVFRKYEQAVWNNDFYTYLITPSGISNISIQSVGSIFHTGFAKISFSPTGDKLMFTDYGDLIELYDFDRCTGVISNPRTINPEATGNIYYRIWGSEFSPSGDLIYISTSDTVSYLYQYNLNDANPQATRDTLWQTSYPRYAGGDLKRGPDGKIYFSCAYDNGLTFNYPYPDSMYNMYNMYLGVINQPDSLGAACDFQPYSFYLGGKRTYWGLPNNPDYDLGCDTTGSCPCLTGVPSIKYQDTRPELFVSYISAWQKLFINAQHLKGKKYTLRIFDAMGKIIYNINGNLSPPYFTRDVYLPNLSSGVFIVNLETEKETLNKKFAKQ